MTSATPAVIALLVGSAIAIAGLVPWAALQYRRRGTLGVGNAVLAFATVVYGLALVTYTLLPLPDTSEVAAICRAASGPQLTPFAFVGDIAKEGGLSGPRSLLANPAAAQVVFNVILFVPSACSCGTCSCTDGSWPVWSSGPSPGSWSRCSSSARS
ncbi:hypothetical protein [Curtobacterium sp. PhB146]|uniref:hypothetical protein n=1 Tax=Curtobacterium sp. PhB146 TaxID=2485187 RepID=UPI0010DF7D77|nr:hypothetical protein [Curtobacterium sp. PhB146]TCU50634.1 hypothetical protein EDF33_1011137 [Curtobacterium sp. PhB146]